MTFFEKLKSYHPIITGLILLNCVLCYFTWYTSPHQYSLRVTGQDSIYFESPATLRIEARSLDQTNAIQDVSITLKIQKGKRTMDLGQVKSDKLGQALFTFKIPHSFEGEAQFLIQSHLNGDEDACKIPVHIHSPFQLGLQTDKPLYQPGQTILLKTLLRNRFNSKPVADQEVLFSLYDSNNLLLHQKKGKSSGFGIASTTFPTDPLIQQGRYKLIAQTGKHQIESYIDIKQYKLKHFSGQIQLIENQSSNLKKLQGRITSHYLDGEKMPEAHVSLILHTGIKQHTLLPSAKTNTLGIFDFDIQLSEEHQVNIKNGLNIKLICTIKDDHEQSIQINHLLKHKMEDLALTLIPDTKHYYVLSHFKNGELVDANISLNGITKKAKHGVSVFEKPSQNSGKTIEFIGEYQSQKTKQQIKNITSINEPSLDLQTEYVVYHDQDSIQCFVHAPPELKQCTVDLVHNQQTVMSFIVEITQGKGQHRFKIPPGLVGTMTLHAHTLSPHNYLKSAEKNIHILRQESNLNIEIQHKGVYLPGQKTTLKFQVSDHTGQAQQAALSFSAIDQALHRIIQQRQGFIETSYHADSKLLPGLHLAIQVSPQQIFSTDRQYNTLQQALFAVTEQHAKTSISPGVHEVLNDLSISERNRIKSLLSPSKLKKYLELSGEASIHYNIDHSSQSERQHINRVHQRKYKGYLGLSFWSSILILFFIFIRIYNETIWSYKIKKLEIDQKKFALQIKSCQSLNIWFYWTPVLSWFIFICLNALSHSIQSIYPLIFITNISLTIIFGIRLLNNIKTFNQSSEQVTKHIKGTTISHLFIYCISRSLLIICILHGNFQKTFAQIFFVCLVASFICYISSHTHFQILKRKTKIIDKTFNIRDNILSAILVLLFLLILAGLFLPALSKTRSSSQITSANNTLRTMEQAFMIHKNMQVPSSSSSHASKESSKSTRVRKHFPETLLWVPEIITDKEGRAEFAFDMADQITTWDFQCDVISRNGKVGKQSLPLVCKQDFYIKAQLPSQLSLGDQYSIPVDLINYSNQTLKGTLKMTSLHNTQTSQFEVSPKFRKTVYMNYHAKETGNHKIRFVAQSEQAQDATEQTILVEAGAYTYHKSISGVLTKNHLLKQTFSEDMIKGSSRLHCKVYPDVLAQSLAGIESLLRQPHGCFEQTSSTTYPNILILQYLNTLNQQNSSPSHKQAKTYIAKGYQRLISYEVSGGGFSWYGNYPANILLTAYGLMLFNDMEKVHPVDPKFIERNQKWLLAKQHQDGYFKGEGLWGMQDHILQTAYIAWAISKIENADSHRQKALTWLKNKIAKNPNGTATLLYCLAAEGSKHEGHAKKLLNQLFQQANIEGNKLHLNLPGKGVLYAQGQSKKIIDTACAIIASIKLKSSLEHRLLAITWLESQRDQSGQFSTTQGTILAIKTLLMNSIDLNQQVSPAELNINFNESSSAQTLIHENGDKQIINLHYRNIPVSNHLELNGVPNKVFHAVWSWNSTTKPNHHKKAALLKTSFSQLQVKKGETISMRIKLHNPNDTPIQMGMLNIPIPPGFIISNSSLEHLKSNLFIQKQEVSSSKLSLYLDQINKHSEYQFVLEFKASTQAIVQCPPASFYPYYTPEQKSYADFYTLKVSDQ